MWLQKKGVVCRGMDKLSGIAVQGVEDVHGYQLEEARGVNNGGRGVAD